MEYLFIVDTLAQHGAERYLFEVSKALKKRGHTVSVLSFHKLYGSNCYYIEEFEKYGINVNYFKLKLVKNILLNKVLLSLLRRLNQRIFNRKLNSERIKFLTGKNIYIVKWEVYKNFEFIFTKLSDLKICVLSGLPQYDTNPFKDLPTKKTTLFLYYPEQEQEILQDRVLSNLEFKHLPLLIDNSKTINHYSPTEVGFKIGIFARINKDQPTIFALFVLHLLKYRAINCSLHFFGRVYDEGFFDTLKQTAKILKLEDKVFFHGHVTDMGKTIRDYALNVGLMNTILGAKGYSSIELESAGLPIVYYDITNSSVLEKPEKLMFSDINSISNFLEQLSQNKQLQLQLSNDIFMNAKVQYNITTNGKFIDQLL